MDPAARAGRMRQWDHGDLTAAQLDQVLPPDHTIQREVSQKSIDREPPHGNHNDGPDQRELGVQPVTAQLSFRRRRHTVTAAAPARTWIAARDRGDVYLLSCLGLTEPRLCQPLEERLPRAPGERPLTGY